MLYSFFLLVGISFGSLAALIAFLITYQEYRKHQFKGWRLWREALTVGVFTLVFFIGLSFFIGYVLLR
jgi:hypothetical protein